MTKLKSDVQQFVQQLFNNPRAISNLFQEQTMTLPIQISSLKSYESQNNLVTLCSL